MLLGCVCLWLGCDGMSSQPEAALVAVLAALGLYISRGAGAAPVEERRRPTRRRKRTVEQEERERAQKHVPLCFEGLGNGHGTPCGKPHDD